MASRHWSIPTTKDLGDKIVNLTLKQAKELSDYLETSTASSRPPAAR